MARQRPAHGRQRRRFRFHEIDQRFGRGRCDRLPRSLAQRKLPFVHVLEVVPQYPQRLGRQVSEAVETLDAREMRDADEGSRGGRFDGALKKSSSLARISWS